MDVDAADFGACEDHALDTEPFSKKPKNGREERECLDGDVAAGASFASAAAAAAAAARQEKKNYFMSWQRDAAVMREAKQREVKTTSSRSGHVGYRHISPVNAMSLDTTRKQ